MDEISGTGEAADATVVTDEAPSNVTELITAAQAAEDKAEAARRVALATISVEKIKGHLAQAEQNLADAIAAQEALN